MARRPGKEKELTAVVDGVRSNEEEQLMDEITADDQGVEANEAGLAEPVLPGGMVPAPAERPCDEPSPRDSFEDSSAEDGELLSPVMSPGGAHFFTLKRPGQLRTHAG